MMNIRKLKKICIVVALLCALAAMLACPAAAAPLVSKAVLDARDSVVRVYGESGRYIYTGSGFVIGHKEDTTYIVTNRHCIFDRNGNQLEPKIILTDRATPMLNVTLINWFSLDGDAIDMVILEVKGLEDRPALPLASAQTLSVGDAVYALGFPGVADDLTTGGDRLPSTPADVTPSNGMVSRLEQERDGVRVIQHTAVINHGNSGGPLLDDDGAVVGINTWGDETIFLAACIDYVMVYCDKYGIPYTPLGGEPREPEPSAPKDETILNVTSPTQAATTAPTEDLPDAIYVLIGFVFVVLLPVGIIAAIIAGVYSAKRKRRAAAQAYTQPYVQPQPYAYAPPAYAPPVQRVYLPAKGIVGTGGQFINQQIPVAGRVALGRDPQRCHVVFSPTAPGVSALHCEFGNDNGALRLTDRGSSYGTFVNGMKLGINVPIELRPGDNFYLGSEENSFRVY